MAIAGAVLLGIVLVFLFGGPTRLALVILAARASLDPVLNLSKSGSGPGAGALINVVVIALALIFLVGSAGQGFALMAGMWGPLMATGLASLGMHPNSSALRFFLTLASYAAVFSIGQQIVRNDRDFVLCIRTVMIAALLPLLLVPLDYWRPDSWSENGFRVMSTFQHPNILAFFLVLQLGVCLIVLSSPVFKDQTVTRKLAMVLIPVILGGILLTKTRSAWGATAIILVYYAFRWDRRFLLIFAAAPLIFVVQPELLDRLADLKSGNENYEFEKLNSFAWRLVLWESALHYARSNLVFGFGLASFNPLSPQFFPLEMAEGEGADAHSVYVEVLFEMGVIGLMAYLWIFVVLARQCASAWRVDHAANELAIILFVAYLIQSASDNMLHYLSFNWYFWFIMGVHVARLRLNARREPRAALQPKLLRPGS
jgi:O-antigen ligase